jgi:hypothetical protein
MRIPQAGTLLTARVQPARRLRDDDACRLRGIELRVCKRGTEQREYHQADALESVARCVPRELRMHS